MSTVTTDPIADMLARLRNAIAVQKTDIVLPHSKVKEQIAGLLKENGYIDDIKVTDASIGKSLHIYINNDTSNARISKIDRLSTPGRRHYVGASHIRSVMQGRGVIIISTSQGLMTGVQAKKLGVGGELICKVY